MQSVYKKGFTLIELLVVIAIIAILAGLLLPVVANVRKKGYETKAKTEVKSIETALKQYYAEYGKYPLFNGDNDADITFGSSALAGYSGSQDNAELIRVLRALDGAGNTDHENNPRRIVFLEMDEDSLDASGNMIDPWNSQYIIDFDTDFDNTVVFKDAAQLGLPADGIKARGIAVFSFGLKQTKGNESDYIRSWNAK